MKIEAVKKYDKIRKNGHIVGLAAITLPKIVDTGGGEPLGADVFNSFDIQLGDAYLSAIRNSDFAEKSSKKPIIYYKVEFSLPKEKSELPKGLQKYMKENVIVIKRMMTVFGARELFRDEKYDFFNTEYGVFVK